MLLGMQHLVYLLSYGSFYSGSLEECQFLERGLQKNRKSSLCYRTILMLTGYVQISITFSSCLFLQIFQLITVRTNCSLLFYVPRWSYGSIPLVLSFPVPLPHLRLIIFLVQLWQLHVAEQMILDDEEANPERYKDNKFTETSDFDEENSIEYTKAYFKKALLPKTILVSKYILQSFIFLLKPLLHISDYLFSFQPMTFFRKLMWMSSTWMLLVLNVR